MPFYKIGLVIDDWEVIDLTFIDFGEITCKCLICNFIKVFNIIKLENGPNKCRSCDTINKGKINLVIKEGDRFGSWTVIKQVMAADEDPRRKYYCRCDCGEMKKVWGHNLREGKSLRCVKCKIKMINKIRKEKKK